MDSNDKLSKDFSPQQRLKQERDRKGHQSYLFRYSSHDWGYKRFVPYYPWISPDYSTDEVPERDSDFLELELYLQDPTEKKEQVHRLHYGTLFKKYFGKVFGTSASYTNTWVMLPKSKYNEFLAIVNRFGLTEYSDFLLEGICKTQEILEDEIEEWEKPDYQKIKKTALAQMEALYRIVQKNIDFNSGLISKSLPILELQSLIAVYKNETIKIDHQFLLNQILEKFQDILSFWGNGNWENGLKEFANSFHEYPYKNEFKFGLAKAYYKFLTEEQFLTGRAFFPIVKDKPTPNDLVLCIAKLLEMSLIQISSTDETDEAKIKVVRNWIQR